MKTYIAREDVEQWEPLVQWLDDSGATHTPGHGTPPTPVIVSA
jgi:hypothetical protein